MSPDEVQVRDVIAAASHRVRAFGIVEAFALGAAASVNSWIAAPVVTVGYLWWSWRRGAPQTVVAAIEETHPASRNVLITASEMSRGTLPVKPFVRERVMKEAAQQTRHVDLARTFPIIRVLPAVALAAFVWIAFGGERIWRGGPAAALRRTAAARSAASTTSALRIAATVRPPAYTSLEPESLVDPSQIAAIEGSTLSVNVDTPAQHVSIEQDGASRSLSRGADGHFVADRIILQHTGYLVVVADAARWTVPIVVSPDALPAVRITAPGRDLVFSGGNPRITFDARASDDFGLRSLTLDYTKVSGSGEQFDFKDGQLPLTIARRGTREWQGAVTRSLAELDLKEGDTLVYRATAIDDRPSGGRATSDAFFIEVSKLGVEAGEAFTLPEQETRYALSQEMLIRKTDRLNQRRASMTQDEVLEESLNLAVEQRMIRAEFVFMLGGEVDDEEVEAEQSVELQAGRLQNRGQADLRAATQAMSQAQTLLTGVSIPEALTAERAAVAALQRAFAHDRYILRALATRSELDLGRRLTGIAAPIEWRRDPESAASNRRAALLQNLLKGLGDLTRAAASGGETERAQTRVLAEEALRTDPESAALRQTSVDLQALAGRWQTLAANARTRELRAVASRLASEAQHSLAGATLASSDIAPDLRAALSDHRKGAR